MKKAVCAVLLLTLVVLAKADLAPAPGRSGIDPYATAQATGALINGLFDLAVAKRDPEAKSVSGECRIQGAAGTNITMPCQNLKIVLREEKGAREVASAMADRGHFDLPCEKGQRYRLDIDDGKKGRLSGGGGIVRSGDRVVLTLETKAK
jgi:hypothetical protein